jgi:hypothetical protein
MNNVISVGVKTTTIFIMNVALATTMSSALACSTEVECKVQKDFYRAERLHTERLAYSHSVGNGLAQFADLKSYQEDEVAAGDARMKAFDEAARRAFVPFSDADIANARRNILIVGANDGRASRQTQLGIALLSGDEGFRVDVEKGIYWLRKAAAQGDVSAIKKLALIYLKGGYGIKPDYFYGFQLYEVLIGASGMPESEQASVLMNQAIAIFSHEDGFYPLLVDSALKANTLGVPAAPQVIYKLTVVSLPLPTPMNTKLRAVLEAPSGNPYLIAANAVAISRGAFGIAKDIIRSENMLKAEANLGHQPAIDILNIRACFAEAKTPEAKKGCEPLEIPFNL